SCTARHHRSSPHFPYTTLFRSGFLEVQASMVKVLADTAIRAGDIDEAAAEEAKKAAEKALNEKGSEFDYGSASARLAEAAAQLRTVQELRKKYGGPAINNR